MMKGFLALLALSGFMSTAFAQTAVWKYVEGGKVIYTNQPIKGKKGEKMETIAYPAAAPMPTQYAGVPVPVSAPIGAPVAAKQTAASPIPAEILQQLQSGSKIAPPTSLPPLPALPGMAALPAAAVAAANQSRQAASASPLAVQNQQPAAPKDNSPSWAKPAGQTATTSPSWAKDPFSQSN